MAGDVYDLLTAIEQSTDVNDLAWDGVCAWPQLRLYIATIATLAPARFAIDNKRPDVATDSGPGLGKELRHHPAELDRVAKADILVWAKKPLRPVSSPSGLIDTIFDPIRHHCGTLGLRWQKTYLTGRSKDGSSGHYPAAYLNAISALAPIAAEDLSTMSIDPAWSLNWQKVRQQIGEVLESRGAQFPPDVRSRLGALFDPDRDWLVAQMETVRRLGIIAETIVDRVRPQLVLLSGQNQASFAMAAACRARGITSVDVQHGSAAINTDNAKWFGLSRIPDGGYAHLPDLSWTWSEDATKRINESNRGDTRYHRAITGGYPWLSACADMLGKGNRHASSEGEIRILVSLTYVSVEPPPDFLWEAIDRSPENWRWFIRLHPIERHDRQALEWANRQEQSLSARKLDILDVSDTPLPVLLGLCDRHVTTYSSTHVDATAFGLGTVFVSERAREFFPQRLTGETGFEMARSADELIVALNKGQTTPPKLVESDPALTRATIARIRRHGQHWPKRVSDWIRQLTGREMSTADRRSGA